MSCPNCSCTSCLLITGSLALPAEFSPPPLELMTTNRAPTDSEVASSRAVIDSAERRVSMIQAMLDDLEWQKSELLSLVCTHRAAISPLKSFPPELLVELFAECANPKDGLVDPTSHPPLMIMGICSRWRRIALDTPRLWTKIPITLAPSVVDSWIIRSKELPLQMQLNLYWCGAPSYSALEALLPHAHRWERVNFTLGPSANSALAPAKTRLHSLKRLELSFVSVTGTVDFCEVAPQLTEILLDTFSQRTPIDIKLPWKQLQVCTLDNSGIALYILQEAKNLRTCRLDMSNKAGTFKHPWSLMPARCPHIHHPELDSLIIDWNLVDPTMPSFFSSLTLPALRTLDVQFPPMIHNSDNEESDTNDNANGLPFTSIIFKFFERSSIHLNMLSLADIPLPPSELISCLALVPSLVSLDIGYDAQEYEIDDELLDSLNVNLPGSILHCLSSLSIRGWCTFSEKSLDALVKSRRDIKSTATHRVALLETLTLDCTAPRDWPASRPPSFHRFVSGGLNITYGRYWRLRNSTKSHEPSRKRRRPSSKSS